MLVKLSACRIVEATIKAIVDTTDGLRLQVSFGEETAPIYPWQFVIEARRSSGPPQLFENGAFDGRRGVHLLHRAVVVLSSRASAPTGCSLEAGHW